MFMDERSIALELLSRIYSKLRAWKLYCAFMRLLELLVRFGVEDYRIAP